MMRYIYMLIGAIGLNVFVFGFAFIGIWLSEHHAAYAPFIFVAAFLTFIGGIAGCGIYAIYNARSRKTYSHI